MRLRVCGGNETLVDHIAARRIIANRFSLWSVFSLSAPKDALLALDTPDLK